MQPLNQQGMFLETILNITHEKFKNDNECLVIKIPTNWIVTKANDHSFLRHEACDYIGNYQGFYFEFEAKETYKDYFDWKMIRTNQLIKMNQIIQNQGITFLIIYFGKYDAFYYVDYLLLKKWVEANQQHIAHEWFEINAQQINLNSQLKLDYLNCLDKAILKK
ncbi:Holliday junction resolvase RecU [Williamsoniiplasma lucivorax]|uniref:Holliday junction resolvase RecU n=1 Tax=Williamsoniiplasma lucivorax TaxID=209274 RepID=A0A2S5RD36_9MOLU|nr:Holliday junction resolvase RecU [Williamsoniiplasma lucivorax]PPE05259.1 Holliday junction-specific endonuclease [Williamsoniiplasma lucivorax]